MSILEANTALRSLLDQHISMLAEKEHISAETIRAGIENGTMVLLGNPSHGNVLPTLVGQPAGVKVNANIGTSPLKNSVACEMRKLQVAEQAGADTVMDLSIAGDLDAIRREMLSQTRLPLGTVPMYSVAQRYLDADRDPAEMDPEELFEEIEKQAGQGVDFITVHCGLTRRGAELATDGSRLLGIVSRGGSILARWMLRNNKENPLLTGFDRLIDICRRHNVTFSLGDGLRPGAGHDAGDAAQYEEVMVLGQLAKRALAAGAQCMIEGPGHVPFNQVRSQIQTIKRMTNNAPLYVLGPLTIDSCPGYDHIAGAIGGAIAVEAGVDFLCYLTPAEHLTLPTMDDVHAGVVASRIAAQAGEVALGRAAALEREEGISRARKDLDWDAMKKYALDAPKIDERRGEHKDEEECAMCGKFCAVKMLREDPMGKI
ncbi:thiamine biosynthesis protein ThiC [Oleidesulfovibrio alaskensis G20]|jgi:phosphomethylpyrimidine synthase|uniref:Phosphomethylpyrimidine synthase n=1 Tax=Oleidesulfovibrio alaskensis (strain ATCC BAA-1058 / DSM 17464 / G20) TaxID=207559 RepID=Q311B9_OLEA2|nr:phosphomethylpyrimidine synthase ThiC [Oleidesulfovibrio alaskensis]ABB38477.1 thiamine biosynthesis protein ThiC [Oleidesulfovibrio alaskensis G20]MBG0773509.1 phosphomethylpyrimidine synthase ThiC [Oleidesulfovibrio alaskensis]MBL3583287.1 phosphomethylpyrimidine synthase ThiC [Oleidesulfovibrio alaskensis]